MLRRQFLAGAGASLVAAAGIGKASAAAADVGSFYRGNTLRIVVGYGAGGGFDVYARIVARHIGKHIPGKPSVMVENMPGAGGLVAANALYNARPKDGTVIAHLLGELALLQILGYPTAKFVANKFNYIGAPTPDTPVLVVRKDTDITSMQQLRDVAKPILCAGQAPGTNTDDPARVLSAIGMKLKVVDGYQGTHAMQLAVEQGEMQAACFGWESMKVTWGEELQSKRVIPIGCASSKDYPELKSVPEFLSMARNDRERQLIQLGIAAPSRYQRVFMGPPGIPKERVEALRHAFSETMKDPEFLADAGSAKLSVKPVDGHTLQQLVAETSASSADVKAGLAKTILPH